MAKEEEEDEVTTLEEAMRCLVLHRKTHANAYVAPRNPLPIASRTLTVDAANVPEGTTYSVFPLFADDAPASDTKKKKKNIWLLDANGEPSPAMRARAQTEEVVDALVERAQFYLRAMIGRRKQGRPYFCALFVATLDNKYFVGRPFLAVPEEETELALGAVAMFLAQASVAVIGPHMLMAGLVVRHAARRCDNACPFVFVVNRAPAECASGLVRTLVESASADYPLYLMPLFSTRAAWIEALLEHDADLERAVHVLAPNDTDERPWWKALPGGDDVQHVFSLTTCGEAATAGPLDEVVVYHSTHVERNPAHVPSQATMKELDWALIAYSGAQQRLKRVDTIAVPESDANICTYLVV